MENHLFTLESIVKEYTEKALECKVFSERTLCFEVIKASFKLMDFLKELEK